MNTAANIYSLLEELRLDGKVILKAIDRLYRGIVRTELMAQGETRIRLLCLRQRSTNPEPMTAAFVISVTAGWQQRLPTLTFRDSGRSYVQLILLPRG